mmetsp:Transcript_6552/g.16065  ORF Transcript_6552/g.16065 Transcript_6552/m.16065 type:complete len:489 (-) Transcript_6552:198-1664(-)
MLYAAGIPPSFAACASKWTRVLWCILVVLPPARAASQARASWMEHQWQRVRQKAPIDLTLPGSFRAGSTEQLSATTMCLGGIHRDIERRMTAAGNWSDVGLPWSIYHEESIAEQLVAGMRYLSLSLCSFHDAGDGVSLENIFHQDGGFTSNESLHDTITVVQDFLDKHPFELIVLSVDNVYYGHEASGMRLSDREDLASSMQMALAAGPKGVDLISWQDFHASPLERLLQDRKRVAVIMQDAAPRSAVISRDKVVPQSPLHDFDIADVAERTRFCLQQDVRALSVVRKKQHFHCVRVGPRVSAKSLANHIDSGAPPGSLRSLLEPLLKEVHSLVTSEIQSAKAVRLNAIVAPFPRLCRQWEVAMAVIDPVLVGADGTPPKAHEGKKVLEAETVAPNSTSSSVTPASHGPGHERHLQTNVAANVPIDEGGPSFVAWLSLLMPLIGSLTLTTCVLTASSMMFETLPEKPTGTYAEALSGDSTLDEQSGTG